MGGLSCEGLDNATSAWMEYANCRDSDVDVFFIEPGQSPYDAVALCSQCDVRRECLRYAIDNGIAYGVWGGKTPRQRRLVYSTNGRGWDGTAR